MAVYKGNTTYYKVSLTTEGVAGLAREKEGYKWFGIPIEQEREAIIIPIFKGKTFPKYNGITGNEEWIKKLIVFYEEKFYKAEKFAIHGDMCLCNVIFGEKEVFLIDWEHFHYASKDYYGFDILNMLFILLQYEYRWLTYWGFNWLPFVKKDTRIFIRHCWKMLGDSGFLRQPFTKTAWYIQKYMDKNKFILGKQTPEVLESLDVICKC